MSNRFCVYFKELGFVPVMQKTDPQPEFLTCNPKKIGDDVLARVSGELRILRLLRSSGHYKDSEYLVDIGAAK